MLVGHNILIEENPENMKNNKQHGWDDVNEIRIRDKTSVAYDVPHTTYRT